MEEGLGLWWFLYLVLIVKMTDIGGYVFGKRYGKRLLAPYISPNKTWEGAFGGLFLGTLASVLFITNLGHKMGIIPGGSGMLIALVLGLILSIAAQFGDLSESLLKREAGVKDSNQFPGLGGILDILDSLVFTSPILYVFLMISEGGAAG
jgi:phosphatidate cytidylyltransferase